MENIIINIDSKFRDKKLYPSASKFTYYPSEKIKNVKYIRVSSIEFPNLYFSFTSAKVNTSFRITCASNNFDLLVEDGMYSSELLLQAVQDELAKFNLIINGQFEIKFNIINGFVTFQNNSAFTIDFSNGTSRYESLGFQLGFRKNIYVSKTKVVNGQTVHYITSESQLDVVGEHYLFLKINDYGVIHHDFEDIIKYDNSGNMIEKRKYQGDKNILAKMVIYNNKTEHLFENGSNFLTKSYIFRQPQDLTKFNIELIDPKGNTVDMVYMNFSITLEVGVIYDSSLKYELEDNMKNNMQISNLPLGNQITNINKKQINYNTTSEMYLENQNSVYDIFEATNLVPKEETVKIEEKKNEKKKRKKRFVFDY
jgi:hypothetical protein